MSLEPKQTEHLLKLAKAATQSVNFLKALQLDPDGVDQTSEAIQNLFKTSDERKELFGKYNKIIVRGIWSGGVCLVVPKETLVIVVSPVHGAVHQELIGASWPEGSSPEIRPGCPKNIP